MKIYTVLSSVNTSYGPQVSERFLTDRDAAYALYKEWAKLVDSTSNVRLLEWDTDSPPTAHLGGVATLEFKERVTRERPRGRVVTYTHPSLPAMGVMKGRLRRDEFTGVETFYPERRCHAKLLRTYGYDGEAGLFTDGATVTPL